MGYELIITEKPSAALKVAQALDNSKPVREGKDGVYYYRVTHKNKDIIVSCAVGHLYTVSEKDKKKGWTYPVFDMEWKQSSEVSKSADFTSKYVTNLKRLAKDAKEFTIATDYDIEGEVIGLNVLKYICKQKDANRMKFSTMTKDELVRAYEHKSKTIDWGQANAGETRHFLDWLYGINLSRALTLAVKAAGSYKILSSGRVQGPALKIIVDKEKDIEAFIPEDYWEINLHAKADGEDVTATHKEERIFDKKKAEAIYKKVQKKPAIVADVQSKRFKQSPPTPFDLTSLQIEAYRTLGISPKFSLSLAQDLYLKGYISYPRTSSQKLPKDIGYEKIISAIKKQDNYKSYCEKLLKKSGLKPNEGKKEDPAHPAIYPTGEIGAVKDDEARLYDLIVRRFLATFGEDATRETVTVTIDMEGEEFLSKGTRTVEKGWHEYYGRHVKLEEVELPKMRKDQVLDVKEVAMLDKKTSPPKRYTPSSIIKELEKRELGTKATRAAIVDALYDRGYAIDKSIKATEIGIKTCGILEKYCPTILDEELTRHFETEMEEIRQSRKTGDIVLNEAKGLLTKILTDFKAKEKEVGLELSKATRESRDEANYIGACQKCKVGTLMIRKGKFGKFIACDKYPDCKTTFSVPNAEVKSLRKTCDKCGYPLVSVQKPRKRPQNICLNIECVTKKVDEAAVKEALGKNCPRCKEGKLDIKKSLYGWFIGCSTYPKCRYTLSIGASDDEAESKVPSINDLSDSNEEQSSSQEDMDE